MFRFHLVKDRPFQINPQGLTEDPGTGRVFRTMANLPVLMESVDEGENRELSELKEQMEERPSETEWNLQAAIGFETNDVTGDIVAILVAEAEGNILGRLKEALQRRGFELKMRVEIKNFEDFEGEQVLSTSEEGIGELSGLWRGRVGFKSETLEYTGENNFWRNLGGGINGAVITINCIARRPVSAIPKANLSFPGNGPMSSRILQKMLDEGLMSDAKIISAEGEEIKCHKFILEGHSDVFVAMLNDTSNSTMSIPGVIKMDEMCSKSVKALLVYLYLGKIGQALGDCSLALDLFKAAHKYNIPILEGKMKRLLATQPRRWFNVEVVMHLYFFVKNLEDAEELEKKSLVYMKKNYAALNQLPAYIRLFEEEPHTARQLIADIIAS